MIIESFIGKGTAIIIDIPIWLFLWLSVNVSYSYGTYVKLVGFLIFRQIIFVV